MNSIVRTINRASPAYPTALLLACALAVCTAYAGDGSRETVTFQDLNVSTPDGVKALYARIHKAAVRVCNQSDPVLKLGEPDCILKTEAGAINKVNAALLTAYYRTKTAGQPAALAVSR
jgi:UrcA family protein